jgi:hypothetical protein
MVCGAGNSSHVKFTFISTARPRVRPERVRGVSGLSFVLRGRLGAFLRRWCGFQLGDALGHRHEDNVLATQFLFAVAHNLFKVIDLILQNVQRSLACVLVAFMWVSENPHILGKRTTVTAFL